MQNSKELEDDPMYQIQDIITNHVAISGDPLFDLATDIHAYVTRETERARIDENNIWIAHSTSRCSNDDDEAIATADFKERIEEIESALSQKAGG